MSFATHTAYVEKFCSQLGKLPRKTPTEQYLYDFLAHLCENKAHFENFVSNSPFYEEFFQTISSEEPDDMNCFALLECLIVFCRERQLQKSTGEILPDLEQKLLHFFENSAHWSTEEHTRIHMWYWHTLPEKYATAS